MTGQTFPLGYPYATGTSAEPSDTTDLPAEAVMAVAQQIAIDDGGDYDSGSEYDREGWSDAAEAYIRAALPFLPQHVSPSEEDVARVRREHVPRVTNWGVPRECAACGEWPIDWDAHRDERVLALLSSQPTVEQVRRETREQVAREVLSPVLDVISGGIAHVYAGGCPELGDPLDVDGALDETCPACRVIERAVRIARAAEVVDPRG